MQPQSSRPTPISSGGLPAPSPGMPARPADTNRAEVTRQLNQALRAARMPPPDNHGQDMRPAELMDAAQQEVLLSQDAIAATRAHARAHAAIEAAGRLVAGTYGICQACGKEISPRRLQAVPLTRFCLPCQDAREQQGRDRYRLDEGDE